jgi:hypothetical protein
MEEWKVVPSYPTYEVSNLGNIRHTSTKKIRKQNVQKSRLNFYKKVTLSLKGKRKNVRVHRLIAEAFLPNPDNKAVVNHKNRNTFDNRLENLEWSTQKENDQHWRQYDETA